MRKRVTKTEASGKKLSENRGDTDEKKTKT